MKIRYVYDQILPSRDTDTEQVLNTVTALGRRGVDVELVIPRRAGAPPLELDALLDYYQVTGPLRLSEQLAGFPRMRPLQKTLHGFRGCRTAGEQDVLYTRNLHAVAFGLHFGHRVVYEHFRPWAEQYPPLEPLLCAMFAHANFLGAVLHSRHIVPSYRRVGIPEHCLLIAHNGYEPSRMLPRLRTREAREQLDLPLDGPLVVYTGRIHERKGLLAVLALARALPHVNFALVGSEGEGRVEREARVLTNVVVRPWQRFDATIRYMFAADVLILPPTLEPLEQHGTTVLPMKLFSYLASGRALYAPTAPDTQELLWHDRNAVLVDPRDPDAQARELGALLQDVERQKRLAAGALETAASLTWDARAEKIEHFLGERLRDRQSSRPVQDLHAFRARRWLLETTRWLAQKARSR